MTAVTKSVLGLGAAIGWLRESVICIISAQSGNKVSWEVSGSFISIP